VARELESDYHVIDLRDVSDSETAYLRLAAEFSIDIGQPPLLDFSVDWFDGEIIEAWGAHPRPAVIVLDGVTEDFAESSPPEFDIFFGSLYQYWERGSMILEDAGAAGRFIIVVLARGAALERAAAAVQALSDQIMETQSSWPERSRNRPLPILRIA
jgi:hypothetical protein